MTADEDRAYRERGGDVYHDDPDCYSGRRIRAEDRVDGRGGLPQCPECRARARVRGQSSGGDRS